MSHENLFSHVVAGGPRVASAFVVVMPAAAATAADATGVECIGMKRKRNERKRGGGRQATADVWWQWWWI